jgi:hypothetical protein
MNEETVEGIKENLTFNGSLQFMLSILEGKCIKRNQIEELFRSVASF